jgi:hypothetical protein
MTKAVATNPGKSDQPPPEAGAVTPEEALQGAEFAGEFGETRDPWRNWTKARILAMLT